MMETEEISEMLGFSSTLTWLIAWEDFSTFMKINSSVFNMILVDRWIGTHGEGNGSISHCKHTIKDSCIVKSQNINEYPYRTLASKLTEASITKDTPSQE
jgi:hypothetical protein